MFSFFLFIDIVHNITSNSRDNDRKRKNIGKKIKLLCFATQENRKHLTRRAHSFFFVKLLETKYKNAKKKKFAVKKKGSGINNAKINIFRSE